MCRDGTCILKEWFCDGHVDCADRDDEENCVGGKVYGYILLFAFG